MNKYKLFLTLWVSALIVVAYGCVDHDLPLPEVNCTGVATISFSADVNPIIIKSCAIPGDGNCHNGGNGPDLNWTVFQNFKDHAEHVQDRITRAPGAEGKMPKIGTISDVEIQTIYCWVEQGALQN
jgi:hypothetical protein